MKRTLPLLFVSLLAGCSSSNTSGIIEVTTTVFGNGFKHTVVIKKAKLQKGNSDFLLGDSYIYGELLTTN